MQPECWNRPHGYYICERMIVKEEKSPYPEILELIYALLLFGNTRTYLVLFRYSLSWRTQVISLSPDLHSRQMFKHETKHRHPRVQIVPGMIGDNLGKSIVLTHYGNAMWGHHAPWFKLKSLSVELPDR